MIRVNYKRLAVLSIAAPVFLLSGCAKNGSPGSGSPSPSGPGNSADVPDSTGNWVIQATAKSGTVPFSQLSGYINEQRVGATDPTTGTFLPGSPSSCYAATENIPMQGVVQALRLHLVSFGLDQQVLDISAAKDSTSTHFTGTYSVTGGCADGAAGTVTATRYNALTGTYKGSVTGSSPAQTIALTLSQFSSGTGDARFLLTGSAAVTNVSCFTGGALTTPNGIVVGSHVQMHLVQTQGAAMDITGDFDPGATTITVSNVSFAGGSGCPTITGPVTLTKS